jgi:proton-dependent oligopeptide transporter, POT family
METSTNKNIDLGHNFATIMDHPAGLFVLFFTEMWERFSYYGMRALLVLFLVSSVGIGGWEWSRAEALELYALYTGLVYITPIIGGFIADRFMGYRNAIVLGALLMTLGHASMAFETPFFFYLGLALLIAGNGFFKPNISSVVGGLYKNNAEKKDSAYTIFYMGINAGAFLGILLCGYVGEKVGWSYGFGLAGIFMLFGMLQFWFAQNIFGEVGLKPLKKSEQKADSEDDTPKNVIADRLLVITVLAFSTIFFWMAFEQAGGSMTIFAKDYTNRILSGSNASAFTLINALMAIIPLIIITWVLFLLIKSTVKKYALSNAFLSISFVIIWGIVLWMVNKEVNTKAFEVSFGDNQSTIIREDVAFSEGQNIYLVDLDQKGNYKYLTDEKAASVEKKLAATIVKEKQNEVEIPASWFGILNSLFIITFAPLISKIWASKYNPSAPVKFGLGLMLLGLGFGVLAAGSWTIPSGASTASVSIIWLVFAYLLHTLGELFVSPVGLSYISKLSPSKLVGLMFGVWFTATAIANWLAGKTGSFIDKISEEYSLTVFFLIFTILPITMGVIMVGLNNFLKKKMHGID